MNISKFYLKLLLVFEIKRPERGFPHSGLDTLFRFLYFSQYVIGDIHTAGHDGAFVNNNG